MVTYTHKRLCFKRVIIEKLESEEPFQIVTSNGTFQFTRRQFETVFASILITKSWLVTGLYHWPIVPKKALAFRVDTNQLTLLLA